MAFSSTIFPVVASIGNSRNSAPGGSVANSTSGNAGASRVGISAAAAVLAELGISEIPLIGLAKRLEEVWLPNSKDPIILPRASEGLYLLQRIRDEAHRFAITFHRSKRSKVMLESLLDEIPNLGEARRLAILEHFGSVRNLQGKAFIPKLLPQGFHETDIQ